jgi:peptide subunit release factor RF-3
VKVHLPLFVFRLVNATPLAATVTVPVNVGFASGAFAAREVVAVVAKFASSPSAAASSSRVLSAAGADAITAFIEMLHLQLLLLCSCDCC